MRIMGDFHISIPLFFKRFLPFINGIYAFIMSFKCLQNLVFIFN